MPGLAVATAFLLVLVSIAVLVIYVHHIGRSLRVAALIELVGKDTRAIIDRIYADKGAPAPTAAADGAATVPAARSGVVTAVGIEELVEVARRADCRLELLVGLGAFVPAGAPLFAVHGNAERVDRRALYRGLIFELERTLVHDVAYGVRLLVDIGVRSLADSPLQDPTTAVQAIDRLHDLLRQLARRRFPDGQHRDAAGVLRFCIPQMSWDAYVHLAFDELRLAGSASPQVTRRLRAALEDLRAFALPERAPALAAQLEQLDAAVDKAHDDDRDSKLARAADVEGIGIAASDAK